MLRGKEKSFSSLGWLWGGRQGGEAGWRPGLGRQGAVPEASPVFQQQDPEQIVLVVWLDLPLEGKPVQQLVGHFSQGFPRQIQKDSTCRQWRGEVAGPAPPPSPQQALHAELQRVHPPLAKAF